MARFNLIDSGDFMDPDEFEKFESQPFPFRKFKGVPIKDVPFDYILWYYRQLFLDNIRRYVNTKRRMLGI